MRIGAQKTDTTIEVSIEDDGPGIPLDDVERVFEPFARGERGDDGEGSGLGLTIARELARSYGGDVRVNPGNRSRLLVELRRKSEAVRRDGPPNDQ